MAFKQPSSGLPFKELGSSPATSNESGQGVKETPVELDTTWADQVFDPEKVDRSLVERGLHTDPRVGRGTVNTSTGDRDSGINNAMIDMSV
jgi:hypothetical protein